MRSLIFLGLMAMLLPAQALAFCGFYVAQGNADLFNRASKVVFARDGERSVITMSSDYEGKPSEFAMVVPIPYVLPRDGIAVVEQALVDHIDAFTAPRLVEYHDPNPCAPPFTCGRGQPCPMLSMQRDFSAKPAPVPESTVTIEATYVVGEYDILILSAEESGGLLRWLDRNGYRVPQAAASVVSDYLKAGMKFFVAKVNLGRKRSSGSANLRPLQLRFESKKFGLPIRLGMVNSVGAQDLFLYTLTRKGRVVLANYPTLPIPTDMGLPVMVRDAFDKVYPRAFAEQSQAAPRAAFLEYAWNVASCDPCSAPPPTAAQLSDLGVKWQGQDRRADVFVTRLHIRYSAETHDQDLQLQETEDRGLFQGRYVLRHPWVGEMSCDAGEDYRRSLVKREAKEDDNLAKLVGVGRGTVALWRKAGRIDLP